MSTPIIAYIHPTKGGIGDYSRQIAAIYRGLGYTLLDIELNGNDPLGPVIKQLSNSDCALYHFEIGASDGQAFRLSRRILSNKKPQLLTIHDPGVTVRHPLPIPGVTSTSSKVSLLAKIVRRPISRSIGRAIIDRHLSHKLIHTLYLRETSAAAPNSAYLPQPTYHQQKPVNKSPETHELRVGFGGFWGAGKGLETLIEAWPLATVPPHARLIIAGSTASPDDPYAKQINQQIASTPTPIETPGFVAADELDSFLQSLSVLVLPYWPELPNGTSAMAMRAAELAVPIIASNMPALKGQLGETGAYYVEPKNVADLALAITAYSANPEVFKKRAQTLQKRTFDDYSWSTVGSRLQSVITNILGENQ